MLHKPLSKVIRTTKAHLNRLEALGVHTVKDFLLYFPRTYNDTSEFTKVAEVRTDIPNTMRGKLKSLFNVSTKYGKKITRGIFYDDTGIIDVVWFNQPHLTKFLPRNRDIILIGKAKYSMGKTSLQSPAYEIPHKFEETVHSGRIVPVYHETEGLNSKWLREKLKPLIDNWLDFFKEYMPEEILDRYDLISYREAIKNAHFPDSDEALEKAKERLAFNELFLLQLKVLQKKWFWQHHATKTKKQIPPATEALKECMASLPFELTGAQKRVLKEILNDLNQAFPMMRLVQGDVGSGKTIVAALSALTVVKNGYQVAVMAPTEILA